MVQYMPLKWYKLFDHLSAIAMHMITELRLCRRTVHTPLPWRGDETPFTGEHDMGRKTVGGVRMTRGACSHISD